MKRTNKILQVIELSKQGHKPAAVAKKLGVTLSYVYNIRTKHKSKIKAKTKPLTPYETHLKNSLAIARGEVQAHITKITTDMVNHPPHYTAGGIETIDFIEAKKLGYNLGNVIKYITRSDLKGDKLENLEKAQWYLNREINNLKK
jgi:leucyl aminopeptidase